jgi:hypothetical protein
MLVSFKRTEVQNFRISKMLTFLFFPFLPTLRGTLTISWGKSQTNTMRGAMKNQIGTSEVKNIPFHRRKEAGHLPPWKEKYNKYMINMAMLVRFKCSEVQNFRISKMLTFLFFPVLPILRGTLTISWGKSKTNMMRGAMKNKIGTSEVQNLPFHRRKEAGHSHAWKEKYNKYD